MTYTAKNSVNVSPINPYEKQDRGLFVLPALWHEYGRVGRVKSARVLSTGGGAAPCIIYYTVEAFPTMPKTQEDYLAGTVVKGPGISGDFAVITTGNVNSHMIVENFAVSSFLNRYSKDDNTWPAEDEFQKARDIGKQHLETLKNVGVIDIEVTSTYSCKDGMPITIDPTVSHRLTLKHLGRRQLFEFTCSSQNYSTLRALSEFIENLPKE